MLPRPLGDIFMCEAKEIAKSKIDRLIAAEEALTLAFLEGGNNLESSNRRIAR
jgi:hypothetical protein